MVKGPEACSPFSEAAQREPRAEGTAPLQDETLRYLGAQDGHAHAGSPVHRQYQSLG